MKQVEYTEKRAIMIDDTGAEGHELYMAIKDALWEHSWIGHQNADNYVFELNDEGGFEAARNAIEEMNDISRRA